MCRKSRKARFSLRKEHVQRQRVPPPTGHAKAKFAKAAGTSCRPPRSPRQARLARRTMVELRHATSERLLRHIMATVGNGDVGAESVKAGISQVDEGDADAKREALLNAPSEDGSDEEEAVLKREAPVNCGHIVTWGVPISVEAVCRMRLKPRTSRTILLTRPPLPHHHHSPRLWRRRSEI